MTDRPSLDDGPDMGPQDQERWQHGRGWGPPWARESGGPWRASPYPMRGGEGSGRRFRRGALIAFLLVVLLVSSLASVAARIISGNAPATWITILVTVVVILGLFVAARSLW